MTHVSHMFPNNIKKYVLTFIFLIAKHRPLEPLWPKIPLKKLGRRILPPISEPMPITDAPPPMILPSPPTQEKVHYNTIVLIERKNSKEQNNTVTTYTNKVYTHLFLNARPELPPAILSRS